MVLGEAVCVAIIFLFQIKKGIDKKWVKFCETYPSARNNNHGWCDNIVLVQISCNVKITVLRFRVATS